MNRAICAILSLLTLSACSGVREQFDFAKKAPDEFAVIRRAPLEIPADMTSLPAPQPGLPRPQEMSPVQQARASVLGAQAQPPTDISAGEMAILEQAGAVTVPANIRAQVDRETEEIVKDETPAVDRLRRMIGQRVPDHAVEVDPTAEVNRMKENKAAGKPLTEGETAVKDE